MDALTEAPVRKQLRRWEIPGNARFITFSCYKGLPLLGNAHIRDLFADALAASKLKHRFHLYAWVIMREHAHLLLLPTERLDRVLWSLKTSIAKQVIARWRELDAPILKKMQTPSDALRFWQRGGGFDRNLRSTQEFCREVRYIHQNPVKRGLVSTPEDWKWSSVRWWMGRREGELECDPPPGDPRSWAAWRGYA